MIIFGTRVRHKILGEGQFFCPKCQANRAYKHKRASRYFALYFVPLIPMGTVGEYVECQTCGTAYEPQVLTMKPKPAQPRAAQTNVVSQINTLANRLNAGTPVEYLVRDLTTTGLDREVAQNMVNNHLAAGRKTCVTCGLTYAATVDQCIECHQPLH